MVGYKIEADIDLVAAKTHSTGWAGLCTSNDLQANNDSTKLFLEVYTFFYIHTYMNYYETPVHSNILYCRGSYPSPNHPECVLFW